MKPTSARFRGARALRRRAETGLFKTLGEVTKMSREAVQRLIYELQVQEIELRMQNDELRRAQEEVESAAKRYAVLYESAPRAYLTLAVEGSILEGNIAATKLLNADKRNLRRHNFTQFIAPESQDAFYLFCRRMKVSRGIHSGELNLSIAAREGRVVQVTGFQAMGGDGVEFRIALIDISARKETQGRLEQSEWRLSRFFAEAPIGIQWLDGDGTIVRANQTQLDLQGYSPAAYVGQRFDKFDADRNAIGELMRRLHLGQIVGNFPATLRHRDGSIRHVLMDAALHTTQEGAVYYSVFTRDITYREDLEQKIVEISEREQKRIAQDLHDDLGQILTASLYAGGVLQRHLESELPRRGKEIAKVLDLIGTALNRTRTMSRRLHPVGSEPNGLMSALEELALHTSEVFHRDCVFACPLPIHVGDNEVATHLYRIAQEAITNAIKHGKASRIVLELCREKTFLILRISDNGLWFVSRDSGMGLKIMEYRASLMKGIWSILPDPAGGTVVTCSLPWAKNFRRKNRISRR